jgi:salicylate hydroxylase
MPRGNRPILIAGGGIGGLAAAIALARQDISSLVLERSGFAEESGAGIQLGPNATRTLHHIGALDSVEAHAFRPEAIAIFDGVSGKRLATIPLGAAIEQRYGAPYLTLHRADLHAALLSVAKGLDLIELRPGFEIAQIETDAIGASIASSAGERAEGVGLIGADGLWSAVRQRIEPKAALHFTGATASRALVARDALPASIAAPIVGLWLGPNAHLVHYPVRAGSQINVVAVTAGGAAQPGWSAAADPDALHGAFASWCNESKSLLNHGERWRSWSLYRMPPLTRWTAGCVALLGDAAHPVMPYLAQGAALAIEDAAALAESIAGTPGELPTAFLRYQSLRQARAARVQRTSARLGRLYHLRGPARLVRNLMLKRRSEQASLRRLDWLYRE